MILYAILLSYLRIKAVIDVTMLFCLLTVMFLQDIHSTSYGENNLGVLGYTLFEVERRRLWHCFKIAYIS